MSALDVLVHRRNALDNGWEDVLVPISAFSSLQFDTSKNPNTGGPQAVAANATTLATAGAGTLLAAAILTGLILRDPAGANRTDTTDTATNLVAALPLDANYKEFHFTIVNTADAAETITLAGGSGVTLQTAITIAQNSAVKLTLIRISATALVLQAR